MTDNYSLELRDVEESDAGQYSCQLDVFGHTQTVLHNLTVLGMLQLFFDMLNKINILISMPVKNLAV